MTKTFKVICPDGSELFRTSSKRVYTWAHVFYNKSSARWGAHWASRRDLAQRELDRHRDCAWLGSQAIVPAVIVEHKERARKQRAARTEGQKRAAKIAAKLRRAGVPCKVSGERVWIGRGPWVPGRGDGWQEMSERNHRLIRVLMRNQVRAAGFVFRRW